jgi:hypothetical protein
VPNSLELLRDLERGSEPAHWKLVVAEIHDDAELEGFLKARYGSGCSLGEQLASNQNGVYDVKIQGDGKSLEETQCPLNFGRVVKHFPAGYKVIAWDTGQAYTFPGDINYSVTHDQDMIDSFEFIADGPVTDPSSQMPVGASEEIADWWGIIGSTEPGAQYDDYFERQDLGQIIYFGIESRDPAVQSQIEALRDTGTIVHLYGTVLSNVPDYNGSQILVERIEINGSGVDSNEGWATHTNDEFGFSFQYPADWALELVPRRPLEGAGAGDPQSLAGAIVLTKDHPVISIQYYRISEPAAWDGRFSGGGLPQEADREQLTLFGQEGPKWVWTVNDGIKAIMVQAVNEAADLVLQIELYDGSVQWIGDPAAETLPETAISVLDGILSSFELTQ